MSRGVEVNIIASGKRGLILKRLDAHSYEVLKEDGETVVLSPNEFKEIKNEDN